MAVITFYGKTGNANGGDTSAFCSGRSASSLGSAVAPDRPSGTSLADLTTVSQSLGSSETFRIINHIECNPGVASWASGTYQVTIEVTTANMNLTLDEIHLCRVTSGRAAVSTIGSLTGIARSLGSTGSVTHNVSGSTDTGGSTDRLEVVLVGSNGAMSSQTVFWKVTIATPIDDAAGGAYSLTLGPGSFGSTGQAVGLKVGRKIAIASGGASVTNIALQSQVFSGAPWYAGLDTAASITDNFSVAPDGTTTAARMTHSGTNNSGVGQDVTSGVSSGQWTFSIYVRLRSGSGAFQLFLIDHSTGVSVLDSAAPTATGSWQRFSVSGTAPGGTTTLLLQIRNGTDTAQVLDIWGAQLETGATANTYVPTTTTAASTTIPLFALSGQPLSFARGKGLPLGAGSYTETGQALNFRLTRKVALGQGSFSETGQSLNLKFARRLILGAGSYSESGQDVTLRRGRALIIGTGNYAENGQALTLRLARKLTLANGAFAETGQALTLRRGYKILLATGSYLESGQSLNLKYGHRLIIGAGSFSPSGQSVNLKRGLRIALDAGLFTETGQSLTLRHGYSTALVNGSYALTGKAVNLLHGFRIALGIGAFAESGQSIGLRHAAKVALGSGSFTLAGQDARMLKGFLIALGGGAFGLNGQNVTLTYTPQNNFVLGIDAGTFTFTGETINLLKAFNLPLGTGTFSEVGQDLSLSYSQLRSLLTQPGAFNFAGQPLGIKLTRKLALTHGSYSEAGQGVTLRYARALRLDAGSFSAPGQPVTFLIDRNITLDAGVFALTGRQVRILRGRSTQVAPGLYELTGNDVQFLKTFRIPTDAGYFIVTGEAIGITATLTNFDALRGNIIVLPRMSGRLAAFVRINAAVLAETLLSGRMETVAHMNDGLETEPALTGIITTQPG